MDNGFIASLAGEDLFFMGDVERGVGWSATDGWVCPSNDIVDLYTEAQAIILGVPANQRPPAGEKWKWIKFDA